MDKTGNHYLGFLLFDATNGNLLKSLIEKASKDGSINKMPFLFDSSNNIIAAIEILKKWHIFKVPLLNDGLTSDVDTDWLVVSDNGARKFDSGKAYNLIFDHWTTPSGYYVTG